MRPTKLVMSAFGPYADVVEIDFSQMGRAGVYLVCGDTGAGKTMIFDAICFALFGEASGDVRGGARSTTSMRSDYAESKAKTYVELFFEYRGEAYRVKRNPEYERAKDRGEGTTKQKADAEIQLPDGRVIGGVRKVNAEIEALIGIDAEQFKQIVMLAQGEFRKLLTADTDMREVIFRKLFGTVRYEMMQERLAEESRKLERENATVKTEIAAIAKQARLTEGSHDAAELVRRQDEDGLLGAWLLEALGRQIAVDRPEHERLSGDVEALRGKWHEANVLLKQVEARTQLLAEKAALEADIAALEAAQPQLSEAFERQREHDAARTAATERAAVIEGAFSKYEDLQAALDAQAQAQLTVDSAGKQLAAAQTADDASQKRLASARSRAGELAGADVRQVEAQAAFAQAQAAQDEAQRLLADAQALAKRLAGLKRAAQRAQAPYAAKVDELKTAESLHDRLLAHLNDLQKRQRAGRAGLLAAGLEEGDPCPVCGSTHHPQLAPARDEVPTDEEIDAAAESEAQAAQTAQTLSVDAARLKAALDQACEALATFEAENGDGEALRVLVEARTRELDAAADERAQAAARKTAVDADAEALRKAQSELAEAEVQAKQAADALSAARESWRGASEADNLARDRAERLKGDLQFPSLAAAQTQAEQLRAQAHDLQQVRDAAEKALADNRNALVTKQELLRAKVKQVQETPDADVDATKALMAELEQRGKQAAGQAAALKTRLDANASCQAALEGALSRAGDIEGRYGRVKLLADAATGNLVGRTKMRFEAYVQAIYFDKVIAAANERLKVLTSGQFELVRYSEGAGNAKAGLGLYVIDSFTGRARDASSLSGGESFQASLCLALGLSDIVQAHAGGIEFDTMFVDEGFGSLDQGALGNAISLLSDLSGGSKLVGIISHVEDLKANIPKKIVVTKTRSGSSISLE